MNDDELASKIEYFFSELYDCTNQIIISERSVNIRRLKNDYTIEGFNLKYELHDTFGTVSVDESFKLRRIIVDKSGYAKFIDEGKGWYSESCIDNLHFFNFLCENKDKHVFWFL